MEERGAERREERERGKGVRSRRSAKVRLAGRHGGLASQSARVAEPPSAGSAHVAPTAGPGTPAAAPRLASPLAGSLSCGPRGSGGGEPAGRYEEESTMTSKGRALRAFQAPPLRRSISEQLRDSTARAWDLLWRNVRERRLAGRCHCEFGPAGAGAGAGVAGSPGHRFQSPNLGRAGRRHHPPWACPAPPAPGGCGLGGPAGLPEPS